MTLLSDAKLVSSFSCSLQKLVVLVEELVNGTI